MPSLRPCVNTSLVAPFKIERTIKKKFGTQQIKFKVTFTGINTLNVNNMFTHCPCLDLIKEF